MLPTYEERRVVEIENLKTVGKEDIEATLTLDKQRNALGCDKVSCMAEIGGALGADLVAYGQLGKVGSKYNLTLNVVSSNDASVVARVGALVEQSEDALLAAIPHLARDLTTELDRH